MNDSVVYRANIVRNLKMTSEEEQHFDWELSAIEQYHEERDMLATYTRLAQLRAALTELRQPPDDAQA